MRNPIRVAVVFFVLLVAYPAFAVDPDCMAPVTDQTVWNLSDGDARYCTPQLSTSGTTLPDAGYPMTCVVSVDGLEYDTRTGLAPGVVITVTAGPYRFAHPIEVMCFNSAGNGEVVAAAGIFPPEAPDRSTLLD